MTRALNIGWGPEWPLASDGNLLTPATRTRIERAIEALIALLGEVDGDPDTEDIGDSEPSLAGCSNGDDREYDDSQSGIADPDGLAWASPMLTGGNPLADAPAF